MYKEALINILSSIKNEKNKNETLLDVVIKYLSDQEIGTPEIAKLLGIGTTSVYNSLSLDRKVKMHKRNDEIRNYILLGLTPKEIHERTNVPISTIYKILKKEMVQYK